MKFLAFTLILTASLVQNSFAEFNYTCKEALINSGADYSATLIPGGVELQVQASALPTNRVNIRILNQGSEKDLNAKVVLPSEDTQGMLGSLVRRFKNFNLEFYMVPNYVETTTQKEFLGSELFLGESQKFMLCDLDMISLFGAQE